MPNGNYALGNTYETVTRPVAFSVAKDTLARLGFPEEAYLNFLGPYETAQTKDSAIEGYDNKNWFGTNTEAILKIQEEPITDRIYEASVIRLDNNPIFADDVSHIYIRPIYQPTKMTLSFRLRCQDEITANKIRDDTWARSHLLRHEQIHTITYHWQIPPVFLVILNEAYKLIEKVDQTGESFGKYLQNHFDKRIDTVQNLAGREQTPILPEDQNKVLGWYDFAGVMDAPTFNKDNGTWDVEFSYSLVYDKAIEAAMTYPLVFRQQMIGADFRPTEGMYALSDHLVNPNNVNRKLGSFFNTWIPPKGILDRRYPLFDTWYPENGTPGCDELWVGLTTITLDNRRDILSLNTLGNHKLSETALAFILSDRQYVTSPNRSLFDVAVYSDNQRALPGQVEITEDGMIRTTFDVSMNPVYHVVISFRRDLSTLKPDDYNRLRYNACKVYAVLSEYYTYATSLGVIPLPNKRCTWTIDQWLHIVDALSPSKDGIIRRPSYDPNNPIAGMTPGERRRLMTTVGAYNIITRR